MLEENSPDKNKLSLVPINNNNNNKKQSVSRLPHSPLSARSENSITSSGKNNRLCTMTVIHDSRYTRLLVMHDYSLCTITLYARLLPMHDYSLCTITPYARLLVMHDYSLCTITRYARLLVLHDHSLCKNELGV